jgi:uncharacterized membrane protein
MNKGVGIGLLVIGIFLVIYGFDASDSVISGVSRAFTGAATEKTIGLLLGGAVSTIVGALMAFRRSPKV